MVKYVLKSMLLVCCALLSDASAQWNISNPANSYTINFDTIEDGVNNGTFLATGFQPSPTSGQMNSGAWAFTGWSDGDLAFGGTQITSGTNYTRGTASSAVKTAGIYSFNVSSTATANRTLGFQSVGGASGAPAEWAPGTVTLRLQNTSGSTIAGFDLSYWVYVRNDEDRSSSFNFSYSSDDSLYLSINSLDFASPTTKSASPSWVSNSSSAPLTGLSIANNAYFYLRWSGADAGGISGARDQFALDDIRLSAFTIAHAPEPSGLIMAGIAALAIARFARRHKAASARRGRRFLSWRGG